MTTTTLTGQQHAAAVLAAILTVPGLPDATWTIYAPQQSRKLPKITGQVQSRSVADARRAIDAYVLAFSMLSYDDEQHLAGTDYCTAFTEVSASGDIDGVSVTVWCAGRDVQ
ncbi:MAG: hypothetical protein HOW97_24355 [Catenulispora sp.]|nr:hypothetical protein [Catenulispora sp.]